jgi:hypothetical protein
LVSGVALWRKHDRALVFDGRYDAAVHVFDIHAAHVDEEVELRNKGYAMVLGIRRMERQHHDVRVLRPL